jgi:hypothetical protein
MFSVFTTMEIYNANEFKDTFRNLDQDHVRTHSSDLLY